MTYAAPSASDATPIHPTRVAAVPDKGTLLVDCCQSGYAWDCNQPQPAATRPRNACCSLATILHKYFSSSPILPSENRLSSIELWSCFAFSDMVLIISWNFIFHRFCLPIWFSPLRQRGEGYIFPIGKSQKNTGRFKKQLPICPECGGSIHGQVVTLVVQCHRHQSPGFRPSDDESAGSVVDALVDGDKWMSFRDILPNITLKAFYRYENRQITMEVASGRRQVDNNSDGSPGLLFQANIHRDIAETIRSSVLKSCLLSFPRGEMIYPISKISLQNSIRREVSDDFDPELHGSPSTVYFDQCEPSSRYSREWSDDHRPHAYEAARIWQIWIYRDIVANQLPRFPREAFSSEIVMNNASGPDVLSPGIIGYIQVAGSQNPDLRDALCDLDRAKEEAREEGFPVPSDKALKNARRLLQAMYKVLPWRFEVYATPDGEIAIDVPGGFGRSVILLCDFWRWRLVLGQRDGAPSRAL